MSGIARTRNTWLCLVGLFLGSSGSAHADTITLSASKDNTLYQDPNGSFSNGAGPYFFAGVTNQGLTSIRRGLIQFDLSAIPEGASVTSAALILTVTKTIAAPTTIQLNRVTQNWGEGTSSIDPGGTGTFATTNDATWKHTFFNTATWNNPGGDFVPTATDSIPVTGFGPQTWSGPGVASDVQAWVRNPTTNFGWELLGDESKFGTSYQFGSRENTVATNRPSLTITYTVPEPGVIGLVAIAPWLMARHRRR